MKIDVQNFSSNLGHTINCFQRENGRLKLAPERTKVVLFMTQRGMAFIVVRKGLLNILDSSVDHMTTEAQKTIGAATEHWRS